MLTEGPKLAGSKNMAHVEMSTEKISIQSLENLSNPHVTCGKTTLPVCDNMPKHFDHADHVNRWCLSASSTCIELPAEVPVDLCGPLPQDQISFSEGVEHLKQVAKGTIHCTV